MQRLAVPTVIAQLPKKMALRKPRYLLLKIAVSGSSKTNLQFSKGLHEIESKDHPVHF